MLQAQAGLSTYGGPVSLRAPRMEAGDTALLLLRNFSFAADARQLFRTDWAGIDSQHQNATIHVHCQTLSPAAPSSGLDVKVYSSFDTVEAYQIGSTIGIVAAGTHAAAITANLGPWVLAELSNAESVPLYAVLSVWLQPKNT